MGRLDLLDPQRCEDSESRGSHPKAAMVDVVFQLIAEENWTEAHRYMDALIGAEGAARWLSLELERAGRIPSQLERYRRTDTHGNREGSA